MTTNDINEEENKISKKQVLREGFLIDAITLFDALL